MNFNDFGRLRVVDSLSVAVLVLFGLFLVLSPAILPPDNYGDLVPAEGPLVSFSLFNSTGRNSSTFALFRLAGYKGRFWNEELKDSLVHRLDGKIGATIQIMYAPISRYAPFDGDAIKSYGLSIDSEYFASAENALELDRALSFWILPAIGIGMLGMAYLSFRRFLAKLPSLAL